MQVALQAGWPQSTQQASLRGQCCWTKEYWQKRVLLTKGNPNTQHARGGLTKSHQEQTVDWAQDIGGENGYGAMVVGLLESLESSCGQPGKRGWWQAAVSR